MHRILVACAVIAFALTMRVSPAAEPQMVHAAVTVDSARVVRDVPPLWLGHNMEWVWQGQGLFMPDGTAKDGVAPLMKALKPGLIRYPGGSLANSFRWADSVGLPAERKPVANFFTLRGKWQDKVSFSTEKPLVGFDEFMKFVEQTGAKGAMVIVNCTVWPKNPELSGSAQEAAAWVAYANARTGDRPVAIGRDARGIDWQNSAYWAALRATNGHPEPYRVTHWEIGNEVYDAAQGAGVTGPEYAARVNEFAKIMKSVDPTIKIGTVTVWDLEKWNDPVVKSAADGKGLVDFLIVHYYAGGAVATQSVAMWDTGSRAVPIQVEKAGKFDIILDAAGQPCAGVFPLMKLELDGADLGTFTVDANKNQGKRKEFKFTKALTAGAHTLTVSYLNDEYKPPEDRNLFLEALYLQPEGGVQQRLDFNSPEEMMLDLAASAEALKPRYLDPLDALQKKYGASLPCVLTEYGTMYGQSQDELKKSRDLKSALAAARLAQIALEDPRLTESNFWCIKSAGFLVIEQGPQGFRYAPSGLALSTLMPLSSGKVVQTKVECPKVKAVGVSYPIPWINAVAVRDGSAIALNFISWHPTQAADVDVTVTGLTGRMVVRSPILRVTGPRPDAQNEEGKPTLIVLREQAMSFGTAPGERLEFKLTLAPCSVTTIVINTK